MVLWTVFGNIFFLWGCMLINCLALHIIQKTVLSKPLHTNHCPTNSTAIFEERWIFLKIVIKVSVIFTTFQIGKTSQRRLVLQKNCFCSWKDKLSVTKKEECIKKKSAGKALLNLKLQKYNKGRKEQAKIHINISASCLVFSRST